VTGGTRRILVLAFVCSWPACQKTSEPPKNLLLVTIDTLRADRVGVYGGGDATPNLDRIAAEGAFARNAYAQVPLTRPSHLSMFTGLYPFEHGVRQNVTPPFRADVPLLAEILRERGFRTAGFVSSVVLARQSGIDRGFETYSDEFSSDDAHALFLNSVQKRGDVTAGEAIDWLERNAAGGRFFLWVHLYDPHDPYEPPEPFASRFDGRPYVGEVAFADEQAGRLDQALGSLGVADDTLFVVTSDHGEAFEEHGETGHGYFIYDSTLRVPWIVRGPGVEPGAEVEVPVESVDLLPTVLDFLGVPLPANPGPGRSLAPAFRGEGDPEPKPLYAESLMASHLFGWGELASVRLDEWKLIRAPKPELYNLEEDPAEGENRADRNVGALDRLRASLDALTSSSSARAIPPPESGAEIDPELMEKLGALGYLGSSRPRSGTGSNVDPKDKLAEFRLLNGAMREGLTLLQQNEFARAIERFRAVLESGTESFEALYYTGRALHGLARHREAVAAFEGSLALDPLHGPAYLDLAKTLFELGEEEEALAALERGQKAIPASAVLHEREGEYWMRAGRPREAALAFEEVVARVPEDALSHVRLGEQYRNLGEIELSLQHLREGVRLSPETASYWNSLGMVLGGSGRMDDARQAFERAHELDARDEQYAFNLGLALLRLGRPDEARDYLRKALESNPEFEPARVELSRIEAR
jgi:arylsulfatase A-like enzyme/Tfp pilus assembly protein PilF